MLDKGDSAASMEALGIDTGTVKRVRRAPGSGKVGRGAKRAKSKRTAPSDPVVKGERPKARIGKDKQEMVVNFDQLRDRMRHLETGFRDVQTAQRDFNDACKLAAEKAGLKSAWVRKLVIARVGDKFVDVHRDVQQLALTFDEMGEGGGSK